MKGYAACEKTPTDGDVTAAKGAFQAGNGSFNEADYERAINYWEDAYRRDCTAHPLLLNLARAYELNGQKRHAVTALKTFLERSPGSSEEGQIRRRVEKLDEQIKAEDSAATPQPVPVAQPVVAPVPVQPAPPPPESHGGKRSIVPLIIAGGGAVIGAVGLVVYLGAQSDISAAEGKCPIRSACASPEAIDQGNSGRSRATLGGAIGIVGGVAVVGGLAWYFLQKPSPETASVPRGFTASLRPALSPGYGGLALDARF